MIKIYDGEFQVFDVNGLNVFILLSKKNDSVDIYINYPKYAHLMLLYGVPYEEFNVDDIIRSVNLDFVRLMKEYFIEVEKLENAL